MFLMFWIGSYWREDNVAASAPLIASKSDSTGSSTAPARQITAAAFAAIACMAIWPAYAHYLASSNGNATLADLSGVRVQWQEDKPFTSWKPHFLKPNAELTRFFRKGEQQAAITLLYYRNQHDDSELINTQNRLVRDEDPEWRRLFASTRSETLGGRQLAVREAQLQGPSGKLLVWQWYWIDGGFIVSDYRGKLLQAKIKLMRQSDDGASVMVYAPVNDDVEQARATLRNFLAEHLKVLETALASNRQSHR
jgi:EpsI family protein